MTQPVGVRAGIVRIRGTRSRRPTSSAAWVAPATASSAITVGGMSRAVPVVAAASMAAGTTQPADWASEVAASARWPVGIIVGGTPQPTAPAGTISLSAASLTVAEANFRGACPHTFQFTLSFTSAGAGTVSYQLEASADTPGFVFNLPDPSNSIFNTAGPRTFAVTYNLQFTNAVSGQVWVHFTGPSELTTTKVPFTLTCAGTPTP